MKASKQTSEEQQQPELWLRVRLGTNNSGLHSRPSAAIVKTLERAVGLGDIIDREGRYSAKFDAARESVSTSVTFRIVNNFISVGGKDVPLDNPELDEWYNAFDILAWLHAVVPAGSTFDVKACGPEAEVVICELEHLFSGNCRMRVFATEFSGTVCTRIEPDERQHGT